MPPLRPPPLQPLRPAWSASQLCRGRFLASEARSFATTPDHAANAKADTSSRRPSYAKSPVKSTARKRGPRKENAPIDTVQKEKQIDIIQKKKRLRAEKKRLEALLPKGPIAVRHVPPKLLRHVPSRDPEEPAEAEEESTKPKERGKRVPVTKDRPLVRFHMISHLEAGKSPRRKPFFKPPIPISPDDAHRWQELAKDGQTERIIREAHGIRTGVITKDRILDDATWQRLKHGLSAMAEESSTSQPAEEGESMASADREMEVERTTPADMKVKSEEGRDRHDSRENKASIRFVKTPEFVEPEPEPKPDPITVRQRLQDAIGNIRSSVVANLEDDARPSRYRQDTPAAPKSSLREQRLEELEELLVHAMRRLRELQGYEPQDDLDLSESFPASREGAIPVRGRGSSAFATAEVGAAAAPSRDFNRPIRYLSRDPSRPLPHTTEQAIPRAMRGTSQDVARPRSHGDEAKRVDGQGSLWDKVFGEAKADIVSSNASREHDQGRPNEPSERKPHAKNPDHRQSGSLLDQLFPELDGNRQETQHAPHEEREVPKLSLDIQAQSAERRPQGLISRKDWVNKKMQRSFTNQIVVVQLSGFSKNLSEEDIKRLVPSSSAHIEGWSDPDFIKVIPERDEITLERKDAYFILFRSVRAARDFQEHVRALHLAVKSHTPSSLTSPLTPPPGYTDARGRDIHSAMHTYTIGPPITNQIYCSILPMPYSRAFGEMLHVGGYEPIATPEGDSTPTTKVLFHVEGAQPSAGELRRTIGRDGKDRGQPWGILGGSNSADGIARLTTAFSRNEAVGEGVERLVIRKVAPRYVISFESKGEAQRFVRRWHRLPFRWSLGGVYENGEGPPEARAQVLW